MANGGPTLTWQHALLAARSDQRDELQQARGRVALQDRQPRSAPGVQLPGDAADGERRAVHHRRHAPRGRRARCRDRRAAVDAQHQRRQARRSRRRASSRAAASPTGPTAEDDAHHLRHARLPDGRARREDRRTGRRLRQGRHRRSEARRRSADGPRSPARSACTPRRSSRRTSIVIGAAHLPGGAPKSKTQREGLRPRLRRAHRQAALDLPHDSAPGRVRQRHVGERLVVVHRQRRRVGADERSTKSSALVYLPVELPTGDYYGGHRPGQRPVRREPRRAST